MHESLFIFYINIVRLTKFSLHSVHWLFAPQSFKIDFNLLWTDQILMVTDAIGI